MPVVRLARSAKGPGAHERDPILGGEMAIFKYLGAGVGTLVFHTLCLVFRYYEVYLSFLNK